VSTQPQTDDEVRGRVFSSYRIYYAFSVPKTSTPNSRFPNHTPPRTPHAQLPRTSCSLILRIVEPHGRFSRSSSTHSYLVFTYPTDSGTTWSLQSLLEHLVAPRALTRTSYSLILRIMEPHGRFSRSSSSSAMLPPGAQPKILRWELGGLLGPGKVLFLLDASAWY
jgi:hypothetical protein